MDQHPDIGNEELFGMVFFYIFEFQLWELLCAHIIHSMVTMATGTHPPVIYHEAKSLMLVR